MRRISKGHLSVTQGKFFTKVVLLSYLKYFSVVKILQFKDALILASVYWHQCQYCVYRNCISIICLIVASSDT